jgi:dTDP-4-amino-4,6-dideoxygalactose transaminase
MRIDRFDGPELSYLQDILNSGQLAQSDERYVGRLERAFAEAYGAKYAIAGNAAMSLLIAALYAAGAGTGDEVVCDPIVQFHAIAALWQNAHPTWADVRAEDWLIDPASAEANITAQTKAICCTHLWGLPCEVDRLREIADRRGVVLIEDCAHAMFLPYASPPGPLSLTGEGESEASPPCSPLPAGEGGRRWVGTWGHIGVFSFCQGKHMTSGDGGMAITNDSELAQRLRSVTMFGESPPELATVFRMTEMQAAIALAQLERVRGYIEAYRKSYEVFSAALEGCAWLQPRLIRPGRGNSPYWFSFAFRGEEHGVSYDAFKRALFETGDPWMVGFTQVPAYQYKLFRVPLAYQNKGCPLHGCPYYQGAYEYKDGLCPVAEDLIPRLVTTSCMIPEEEAKPVAEGLRRAIAEAERG